MTALSISWYCHTVDVVTPVKTVDAYGDLSESDTTTRSVTCRMQQDMRTEAHSDGRDPATELWLMFTDDTGISAHDRVSWAPPERTGPLLLEVHGPPEPVYRFTGVFDHYEISLREVHG